MYEVYLRKHRSCLSIIEYLFFNHRKRNSVTLDPRLQKLKRTFIILPRNFFVKLLVNCYRSFFRLCLSRGCECHGLHSRESWAVFQVNRRKVAIFVNRIEIAQTPIWPERMTLINVQVYEFFSQSMRVLQRVCTWGTGTQSKFEPWTSSSAWARSGVTPDTGSYLTRQPSKPLPQILDLPPPPIRPKKYKCRALEARN